MDVPAVEASGPFPQSAHDVPGTMRRTWNTNGAQYGFMVACPKCGLMKSVPIDQKGHSWKVLAGDLADVSGLSLTPKLVMGCCGWMGWLEDGKFLED